MGYTRYAADTSIVKAMQEVETLKVRPVRPFRTIRKTTIEM